MPIPVASTDVFKQVTGIPNDRYTIFAFRKGCIEYCLFTVSVIEMEFRQQKVNLSFSIENILRDDFPRGHKENVVNQPTRETTFERWSNSAVYQSYAVHFSPVFARSLPNMQRIEERLNGFHRGKGQILYQQQNMMEGFLSSYQDESALQQNYDVKINGRKEGKESLNPKTNINESVALKRKRNRSQFTKHQLRSLEKLFSRQKYLTRDERKLLARSLDMTELQIRNWFQNRRYLKKQRANENVEKYEPHSATTCVRG